MDTDPDDSSPLLEISNAIDSSPKERQETLRAVLRAYPARQEELLAFAVFLAIEEMWGGGEPDLEAVEDRPEVVALVERAMARYQAQLDSVRLGAQDDSRLT